MTARQALVASAAILAPAAWVAGASIAFLHGTHLAYTYPVPQALWQWPHYLFYADNQIVARWLKLSAGIATIPFLAAGIGLARWLDPNQARSLHGRARWASVAAAEKAGIRHVRQPDGSGIILGQENGVRGRYMQLQGAVHVALYAMTRAGKGVSFVIPNCFAFGGSLVVLDIGGENHKATAGHRRAMGDKVFLLDFASESGRTARWNPFGFVERGSREAFDQIQRVGYLLFPEVGGKERYWEDRGRSAFIGAATLLACSDDQALSPAAVLRFFARGDGGEALAAMIQRGRTSGKPYPQSAVDALSDYLNGSADLVNGVRSTITARLAIWYNPRVAAATETCDFDLRQLRRKRMVVYVAVSPSDLGRMRPLLALFLQQLVELNTRETPEQDPSLRFPLLLLLDEFARLGKMPVLAQAASYVRKFGIQLAYVVQNKAQVREVYGADGAADIFDNCGAEIVFGTKDAQLCKEVSEAAGYDTVEAQNHHKPRFGFAWSKQSVNTHQHRRALALPQEIARLPETSQIVLRAGIEPIRSRKIRWFHDKVFAALVRPSPIVAQIKAVLAMDDGQTRVMPKAGRRSALRLANVDGDDGS